MRLRRVRQGRVVCHDPQLAVLALVEDPCLVHRGDLARLVGEDDVPHRDGDVAFPENCAIYDFHLAPALDPEACVFWEVLVTAHKVCQCAFACGAEGLGRDGERGLEEHWPVVVPVGPVDDLRRQGLGRFEALLLVGLGDVHQGVPPSLLGIQHLLLRDIGAQPLREDQRPVQRRKHQQQHPRDGNLGGGRGAHGDCRVER
mmetsp:Transcript_50603/g.159315  ORF Transcript_50603/g.159315 Transcript_50603/m.159315 type:complete len:201 (-) Transcript_50603:43-645(-)